MKSPSARSALVLSAFVAIPFIYNACGAIGQSAIRLGLSSSNSSSCSLRNRVDFEDGRAVVRAARPKLRGVFAARKAVLRQTEDDGGKAGDQPDADRVYPAGTNLAVIVDAACLRANADGLDDLEISRAALTELKTGFNDQAVAWTLPRAMTEAELNTLAEREVCVTGLGLNQTYGHSALALNDPQRANQSYLAVDQADAAYNVAFGTPGLAITGSNVIVAVLDSGVDYTHPELNSKMASGYGADVSNGTSVPTDVSTEGHGTHVAGMIAAASNNGVGISGVMPYRAQILAVRIFASGTSSTSSQEVYSGVQYAISRGASVINLSINAMYSGAVTDSVLRQAMQAAVDNGITVAVAMGNSGTLADGVNVSTMPAQYATIGGVMGVGAVNATDGQKSSFSTYGTNYAEISAVGAEAGTTGVLSTVPQALGGYGRLAGTSQATPQVAAAAALAIAMIRNAYGASPEPAAIESLIVDSADKRPELAPYFQNGNRLNLYNLVQLVRSRYPLTAQGKSTGC